MPNENFSPTYSTDNIWREQDMERCLSDDLNTIELNITNLQTGKANTEHTHTGYATTSDVSALQSLVGDTSVASQIASSVATKADMNHTHSEYALSEHTHSYNDLNDKPSIPTTLPADGGNSVTVDGKHASEFASTSDVTALQALIGDTSVSAQITEAMQNVDLTGYATETYVNTQVSGLVDSAPETLNTLNELAAALGDDPNFATTIMTQIGGKADVAHTHDDRYYTETEIDTKLNEKVNVVAGKGLSTEDFTTAEKNKLANLSESGNEITVDSYLSPTSTNPVQNKVINTALLGKAGVIHVHTGYASSSDVAELQDLVGDTAVATQISNAVAGKADSNHTHNAVTTSAAGFMSATDKTKLNGIEIGANKYTLPTATGTVLGGVKIGDNITNSSGKISLTKNNVTSALGYTPFNSSDVIPKSKGGTGANFSNIPANAIIRNSGSGGSDLYYTETANGAFYATSANGYPTFGILPVAQGGTGETKAWENGTVSSLNSTTVTSYQFAVFPYLNKAFIRLNVLLGSALASDGARYIVMPSTMATAHTALSCYNTSGYDIHCGMSSNSGVYVINCGTASMPNTVRLFISGWYSI